jgi:hypothetical protein
MIDAPEIVVISSVSKPERSDVHLWNTCFHVCPFWAPQYVRLVTNVNLLC